MVQLKNIAFFGGSGDLGTPILKAILDSGKFNVTVISRAGSKSTFPASAKVQNVDYTSLDSLTTALRGQDAVVSAIGEKGILSQTLIFDAAVAAGVKHFIPSEFGIDLLNPKAAALPVFGYKVAVRKHIEEKVKAGADITYTYIIPGGFLDWGLEKNFLISWADGKPAIYDGGDELFSATSLDVIGEATVAALLHPEETKNRSVFLEDIAISQNRLLAAVRKAAPERKFEPVSASLADLEKASYEKLGQGDYSMDTMVGFIFVSIFGKGYGQRFSKTDNELLGVKGKTDEDVVEIVRKLLAEKK